MSDSSELRRKQLFSFTITELFLLILFILLLLLWFVNQKVEELEKDITIFQEKTGFSEPSELPDNWTRLAPALREAREDLEKFREKTGFDDPENLPLISENIKDTIETMQGKIDDREVEISILKEEILEKGQQIKTLVAGQGIPPCWIKGWPDNPQVNDKGYDKKEFLFTAILRDNGIFLEKDIPDSKDYSKQYAALPVTQINLNNILSNEEFDTQTKQIFLDSEMNLGETNSNLTLQRQCRHYIRVFDETSADQKNKYKEMLKTIENHFYIYKYQDPYTDYIKEKL